MTPEQRTGFLSVFLVLVCACKPVDPPPSGIDLLAGARSYQTVEQVKEAVRPEGKPWRIVEDAGKSKGTSARSRFDTLTVEIDEYHLHGESGTLRFEFFNDRLMASLFYPRNLASFRARALAPPETEELRVRWGRDYLGREYLACEDARLRAEFMKWIRENA